MLLEGAAKDGLLITTLPLAELYHVRPEHIWDCVKVEASHGRCLSTYLQGSATSRGLGQSGRVVSDRDRLQICRRLQ
jgi:hypothetical protein